MTPTPPLRIPAAARLEAGVTLLEMLIVVAIIALVTGVSYPSISSGLDNLRLSSAADGIAGFLDLALSRADRKQVIVEIAISRKDNALLFRSVPNATFQRFDLPEGISIDRVLPEVDPARPDLIRRYVVYPGGAVPPVAVSIANARGRRRLVRLNPLTGVPQVDRLEDRK